MNFYQTFGPIIIGVAVFIIGQYLLVLVLQPIGRVRRVLADISSAILFRQATITNGGDDKELALELKRLGALLRATSAEVLFYRVWSAVRIFSIPSQRNILAACRQLNLLSAHLLEVHDEKTRLVLAQKNQEILELLSKLLNIHTHY